MSLFLPSLVHSLRFISSTSFIFDFILSSTYSVPVSLLTTLRDIAEFPAFLPHCGVTPGFLFLCAGVATIVLCSQQLWKHQGRPLMLLGVVVRPCLAHQAGHRHVDCAVVPAAFVHITLLCGKESCSKGKSSSANVMVIAIIILSLPPLWSLMHNHCLFTQTLFDVVQYVSKTKKTCPSVQTSLLTLMCMPAWTQTQCHFLKYPCTHITSSEVLVHMSLTSSDIHVRTYQQLPQISPLNNTYLPNLLRHPST